MRNRLEAIAALVPHCDTFYDIGTDHGLLPAFLLREGRCRRAVPCDISPDSLQKAVRLLERMGLSDRAYFHLGDGLEGLSPGPEDCVAVCGMGARAILRLLPENLPCPVVLSTHVDIELLRQGILEKGYGIECGRLIREDRRYYPALRAYRDMKTKMYSPEELYIGRELEGDPLLGEYLDWKEGVAREAAVGGEPIWRERLQYIEEARAWQKK